MHSLQDYATLGASIAVLLGALWTGVQSFRAKQQATRAAENSHPISNGWGTALREDMAALRRDSEQTRRDIGRIHESQLLAERRETKRDDALDELRNVLEAHIAASAPA